MLLPESIRKLSAESFRKKIERLPPEQQQALTTLKLRHDVSYFAQAIIPEHCRLPFAAIHERLFAAHHRFAERSPPNRRGLRLAFAAPRGAAKSTVVSLLFPLHDLVFATEPYTLLLSATERQARQRLKEIRTVLTTSKLACPNLLYEASRSMLRYGTSRIDAYGAGTELRGISHNGFRPSKIILDDAENSRCATSRKARERIREWYSDVVEHLGDVYTHIIAIGTILHADSLLSTLLARSDFEAHCCRSIEAFSQAEELWKQWRNTLLDRTHVDPRTAARLFFEANRVAMEEGTAVFWREKEDYEELMAQLTLGGRRAFYQEKQNLPQAPDDAIFSPAEILCARYENETLAVYTRDDLERHAIRRYRSPIAITRRVAYLDSALARGGRAGRSDLAAVAIAEQLTDGVILLRMVRAARIAPREQIALLVEFHRTHPLDEIAVEGNGFQQLLQEPLAEAFSVFTQNRPALRSVVNSAAKTARIAALEPMFSAGSLIVCEDVCEEFWEEIMTWPRSEHDDALDAVAGAVSLLREPKRSKLTGVERIGREQRRHTF